jgi:tetratricopeptide (TPR) repeat protein
MAPLNLIIRRTAIAAALIVAVLSGVVLLWWIISPQTPPDQSEDVFGLSVLIEKASPDLEAAIHQIDVWLRQLAEIQGVTPELANIAAHTLLAFGRGEDAARLWEECLKKDPKYLPALCGLGEYFASRGEHERALGYFRQAREIEPTEPAHAVRIGQEILAQGRLDEVIALLLPVVEESSQDVAVLAILGQAYLQKKSFREAIRLLERTVFLAPGFTNAYFGLGQATAAMGEKALATEYFQVFQALKKRDEEAHRELLRTKDDVRDTRRRLAEIYTRVAAAFLGAGDPETAEMILFKARELFPESGPAMELLAWLYHRQGRRDKCLGILEVLAEQRNYLPGQLLCGSLFADLKMYPEAEQALKRAVELAPQQPSGYAALAGLYLRWGEKLPEARRMALKAVDLEPSAENLELLATICIACGDNAGAISARHLARLAGGLYGPDEPNKTFP